MFLLVSIHKISAAAWRTAVGQGLCFPGVNPRKASSSVQQTDVNNRTRCQSLLRDNCRQRSDPFAARSQVIISEANKDCCRVQLATSQRENMAGGWS